MSVNHFLQPGAGYQPYLRFHNLAILENEDGGQHRNAVFRGQSHILIDVDLGDFGLALVGVGKFIDNWTQFSTGASRRSPKVNQDRRARFEHFAFKCVFIQFKSHIFLPKKLDGL